jgi:hypothetical protein
MTSAAVITMVAAGGRRSRLRRAVTHCRSASRLLRTPASRQSRNGLDWTNFFIADIQTGFGTFVAFYLADLGWSEASVGSRWQPEGLPAWWDRFRAAPSPTPSLGSADSSPQAS